MYTRESHWPHSASRYYEKFRQMLIFTVNNVSPSPNPKALTVVVSLRLFIQYICCCPLHLVTVSASRKIQTRHTVVTDTD